MATVINPDSGEYIVNGNFSLGGDLGVYNNIRIDSTNDIDLNSIPSSYTVSDAALNVAGGGYIGSNLYVGGTLIANGDVITLGNTGGSLTLSANINSDILPAQDQQYNIGSSSNQWNVLYCKQTVIDSSPTTAGATVDITSGMCYVDSTTPANSTLADGIVGQTMTIVSVETTNVEITPNNSLGFTSFILTSPGQSVSIVYTINGWVITSIFGASIN